eukprot:Gregarina_sp_Poly_1__4077@NODE_223_length_11242_cov_216_496107_g197_i0_p5_GENE_NODE_223_length_11242_cov_216_496107_g197_i0NODE_223_length_11242_cov_216_496107_g197_i0_p5_ORF_typecomplete_len358_score65_46Chromo/PF00385_24/2e08SapC/PF07277_11/0_24_NODE_223_length_11242_cov_216_496107_g197_i041705243
MTYTNARNLLLELEVLHQERCANLRNVQEALGQFATRFRDTVDWVAELNQVDLLSLVRAKLERAVVDLHAVLKTLPPLPPEARVQIKDESPLSPAVSVVSNASRKRTRTTGSRHKRRQPRKQPAGEYYTIEKIVGFDDRPGVGIYYKVQWEGYPGQDTWEPEAEILAADAEDLILEYKRRWNETHPANVHWDIPISAPALMVSSSESSEPIGRRRRQKLRHRDSPRPKKGLQRDRLLPEGDTISRDRDTFSRDRDVPSGEKDTPAEDRDTPAEDRDMPSGGRDSFPGGSFPGVGDSLPGVSNSVPGDSNSVPRERVALPGFISESPVFAEETLQNVDSVDCVYSMGEVTSVVSSQLD